MSATETTARSPASEPAEAEHTRPGPHRTGGPPLRRAPVPRRPAPVGAVGILLAVVLTGAGVLAIYDGVVILTGGAEPVLTPVLTGTAQVDRSTLVAVLAGLGVLVGLLLLSAALRPGSRRGVRVDATTGVWMTWSDVDRLAAAAAERVDGVLSARARAGAREVRVSAETTDDDVEVAVREAVAARLAGLASPPRVKVRTHRKGES